MGRVGRWQRSAAAIFFVVAGCSDAGSPAPATPGPSPSEPAPAEALPTEPVDKDCTWQIGSMGPLSGDAQALGRGIDRAVRLAATVANADPEVPCKLKVVSEDSRGSVERAAALAPKLAGRKRLVACVCGSFSGEVLSMGHVFGAAGVLLTGPATHELTTRRGFDTWFQAAAANDAQAEMAALYISEALRPERAVFVHDRTSFGTTMTQWVAEGVGDTAGKTFGLRPGRDSYAELAGRVAKEDPDLVYFAGYAPEAVVLVQDLRDAGFEGTFFGTDGIKDFDYANAGDAAMDTSLTCPCVDAPRTPAAVAFADLHREQHGEVPGAMAAETFDVATFVADALRELDGDEPIRTVRKQVVRYFDEATRIEGIAKAYSWNARGELTGRLDDVWIYEWSDDEITFLPAGTVEELVEGA